MSWKKITLALTTPIVPKARAKVGKGRGYFPTGYRRSQAALRLELLGSMKKMGLMPLPPYTLIRVDLVVVLPRPKRRPGWLPREAWSLWASGERVPCPADVGDVDNFVGAVMDACNPKPSAHWGGLWHDDANVFDSHERKFYAAKGEPPHAVYTVEVVPW